MTLPGGSSETRSCSYRIEIMSVPIDCRLMALPLSWYRSTAGKVLASTSISGRSVVGVVDSEVVGSEVMGSEVVGGKVAGTNVDIGVGIGVRAGVGAGVRLGDGSAPTAVGLGVGVGSAGAADGLGLGAEVWPVLAGAGVSTPSTIVKVYVTAQRRSPLRSLWSNSSATIVCVPIVAAHGTNRRFWRALSPSSAHGAPFSVAVTVALSR